MRKGLLLIFSFLTMVTQGQDFEAMSSDVNRFALSTYAQMAGADKGNFVFSPLSLNFALRMVEAGAVGKTYSEMETVLNPDEDKRQIGINTKRYSQMLQNSEPCAISIANSVWVSKGYKLLPGYVDTLKASYGADCSPLDFSSRRACRRACVVVNQWVSDQTNGKILRLLEDNMVNANTRMILVNAISFKCEWMNKFKSKNNIDGEFHSIDGSVSNHTFMSQTDNFGYADNDDFQAVELPYSGGRFSMLIILPRDDSFDKVETALTADLVLNTLTRLSNERVALTMPKFKGETSVDFSQILRTMGVVEAFGAEADFSAMSGRSDLQLSQVVQKTVIDVDESGTEAASATAATMMVKSAFFPELKHFTADRPFVYFIVDVQTNTILFAGRYVTAH